MKKLYWIIALVVLALGLGAVYFYGFKETMPEEPVEEEKCAPFTGGSFTLQFVTNGGNTIEDKSVCIACGPDTYENLPTPTRKKYKFKGWYLDAELTQKFEGTSTLDITPVATYDEDGCQTGYDTIVLYAKWAKK